MKLHRRDLDADDMSPELARPIAPGRVPVTARLVSRAVIFRNEFGIAGGADEAVQRAQTSSGAPLPAGVRSQFESSLGADLSAVRVHTGADSAAAADAVGARAYATGQDIHFGADQYAPSDPFGLHLLAHEVAHTVQQGSGLARSIQRNADPNAKQVNYAALELIGGDAYLTAKREAEMAEPHVTYFREVESHMDGTAMLMGVNLDDPVGEVAKLAKLAPKKLGPQETLTANLASDGHESAQSNLNKGFMNVSTASDKLETALRNTQALPDSMAPPKLSPSNNAGAGDGAEHGADAVNSGAGAAPDLMKTIDRDHALALLFKLTTSLVGTDVLKEAIKNGLDDNTDQRIDELQAEVKVIVLEVNALVDLAKKAAKGLLDDAQVEWNRAAKALVTDMRTAATASKLYMSALDTNLIDPKEKAFNSDGAKKAGPTESIVTVYKQIIDAKDAWERTEATLETHELTEARYKYWYAIVVPLGTTVLDKPAQGAPGAIAHDMLVLEHGGKQYAFWDTRENVEAFSLIVQDLPYVYEHGPKAAARWVAWSAAMNGALGMH